MAEQVITNSPGSDAARTRFVAAENSIRETFGGLGLGFELDDAVAYLEASRETVAVDDPSWARLCGAVAMFAVVCVEQDRALRPAAASSQDTGERLCGCGDGIGANATHCVGCTDALQRELDDLRASSSPSGGEGDDERVPLLDSSPRAVAAAALLEAMATPSRRSIWGRPAVARELADVVIDAYLDDIARSIPAAPSSPSGESEREDRPLVERRDLRRARHRFPADRRCMPRRAGGTARRAPTAGESEREALLELRDEIAHYDFAERGFDPADAAADWVERLDRAIASSRPASDRAERRLAALLARYDTTLGEKAELRESVIDAAREVLRAAPSSLSSSGEQGTEAVAVALDELERCADLLGEYGRGRMLEQLAVIRRAAASSGEQEARELDGAGLIAAERRRQVEQEGWTPEHDDAHVDGTIAKAAVAYATDPTGPACPFVWPWEPSWWKPTGSAIGDLVKAGALVAAEIDRLQRAPSLPEQQPDPCEVCGERPGVVLDGEFVLRCEPCAAEVLSESAPAETEGSGS